mgnify:CR=1 FL=1
MTGNHPVVASFALLAALALGSSAQGGTASPAPATQGGTAKHHAADPCRHECRTKFRAEVRDCTGTKGTARAECRKKAAASRGTCMKACAKK